MKIYLVRHGIAYEPGEPGYEDDTQRPLTDKGRDKMNKVAHVLKRLNMKPDVILSSPYLRTRQTAENSCQRAKIQEKQDRIQRKTPADKPA